MQIFSEVFGANAGAKRDIMRVLKNGACSAQELASALGTQRGGHIARNLEELELAGFVGRDSGLNPETGSRARQGRYRLADNYTRFYLNFIEPHLPEIEAGHFAFASLDTLPGWDSTLGLQFENLIVNHASELLPYLNLSGIPILEGDWHRWSREMPGPTPSYQRIACLAASPLPNKTRNSFGGGS